MAPAGCQPPAYAPTGCGPRWSSPIGVYGPSCSPTVGFGRPQGSLVSSLLVRVPSASAVFPVHVTSATRKPPASADPTALLPFGPGCSAVFGFSRLLVHANPAVHQPSAFMALPAPHPSASVDTMALVTALVISLRAVRRQLLGSPRLRPNPSYTPAFDFGRPSGLCNTRCSFSLGLYGPRSTTSFGVGRPQGPRGVRPIRPWVLCSLRLWTTSRST